MIDWKPMASAPRIEGVRVLLWTGDEHEPIEIGHWAPADATEPESRETWCDSGREPTHWMPLPKPPFSMMIGELRAVYASRPDIEVV